MQAGIDRLAQKPLRYAVAGAVTYALGLALVWFGVERLSIHYLLANVLALLLVFPIGFTLQRVYAFRSSGCAKRQSVRLLISQLSGFTLAMILIYVLVESAIFPYLAANVVATATVVSAQYLLAHYWIFARQRGCDDTGESSLLLVTPYFPGHGGGVERVAFELLSRNYFPGRVTWMASNVDAPPSLSTAHVAPAASCNVLESKVGVPYPIWSISAIRSLARNVASADCVHVHECQYVPCLLAAWFCLWHAKPLIVTQHVGEIPYQSAFKRLLLSMVNRLGTLLVLKQASKVMFISPLVKAYFERLSGPEDTFEVSTNGVDSSLFFPKDRISRPDSTASRAQVLFVGRFVEKKGLHIVRAVAALRPNWGFVLVGAGPINPRSWRASNVIVHDPVHHHQLPDIYRNADLFLLPSVGEGFPLVVQEAMASGCVCAVSDELAAAGNVPRNLLLAAPTAGDGAAATWVAVMERHLSKSRRDRESLSRSVAAFAIENWSWDHVAKRYHSLFNTLLSQDRNNAGASPRSSH